MTHTNPYASCYVEKVKGWWRISNADGSRVDGYSFRRKRDADALLLELLNLGRALAQ